MQRLRPSIFCISILALTACAAAPEVLEMSAPFDESRAEALMMAGPNTIRGEAWTYRPGRHTVSCAGRSVYLIPATEYALERMDLLLDSGSYRHFPSRVSPSDIQYVPDYPAYYRHMRSAVCDARGQFTFAEVADGPFILSTTISWYEGTFLYGVLLGRRVDVADGSEVQVTLSP